MTPDGAVRALVGGRNYAESQFNRAVAAKRQPGSAFKPFVYLTALERGLTPERAARTSRSTLKGWRPGELHPRIFRAGDADAGAGDVAQHGRGAAQARGRAEERGATAYRLGIASKLEANASIALGTSEVSLIELVGAYAPFANGGLGGLAAHVVTRSAPRKARCCTCAQARTARPHRRAAPCRDDEHDDAGDAALGTARKAELPAGRPPARPAPARISATPGSSATRPTWSPASGSATTTTRRPGRRPAAACRWKSGPASCARRIRACRWRACRARSAAASVEPVSDGVAGQRRAASQSPAPVPLARPSGGSDTGRHRTELGAATQSIGASGSRGGTGWLAVLLPPPPVDRLSAVIYRLRIPRPLRFSSPLPRLYSRPCPGRPPVLPSWYEQPRLVQQQRAGAERTAGTAGRREQRVGVLCVGARRPPVRPFKLVHDAREAAALQALLRNPIP